MSARVEVAADRRAQAGRSFVEADAPRLAELCLEMARRFLRGGRLLAVADSPQGWSDARHVAVEFVHPVIVGKRALPALALHRRDLPLIARADDMLIDFDAAPDPPAGCLAVRLEPAEDDPFVRQELVETAYHLLWELVHVFFEHLETSRAGGGDAAFLYPFLDGGPGDLGGALEDVQASMVGKSREISRLRSQTLAENRGRLAGAARALREAFERGGKLLAFGNGGSATDAMDLVADLRAAPQGWPPRPALDLTEDPAVLTALANDIGAEVVFGRQIIAHAAPGDVAVAFSTSGGSENILAGLAEARSRELATVAFVGYDGGRIAAEGLADHVVVTRSEHIPRIQEAQATAYHTLLELVQSSSAA